MDRSSKCPRGSIEMDEPEPGILVALRVGPVSGDEMSWMLDRMTESMLGAEGRVAFVYDAGTNPEGRPDAEARRRASAYLKERRALIVAKAAGTDFVFRRTIQRGVLTAILWMAAPPAPYGIHATREAALHSARLRLRTLRRPGNSLSP